MTAAMLTGHWPQVLFAASEAYPLAKTGGLGDVAGALPISLAPKLTGMELGSAARTGPTTRIALLAPCGRAQRITFRSGCT
jgi:starch synthase